MGTETIIAWTNHTFNISWGCVKVSPGCAHCYAETGSKRYGHSVWGPTAPRRIFGESHWNEPLKWNREAEKERSRHRVFTSSMCDVFEQHKMIDKEREKLWPLIRNTPWLDWQVLTKRSESIADNLPKDWGTGYSNVWLGVSAEDQKYYEQRWADLAPIPAVVRFVSYEPALGPIELCAGLNPEHGSVFPDWIIYGGESGPGFRKADLAWPRSMRDQCKKLGIPFFHKQSSGIRTEMGIQLDGAIIREYPAPRGNQVQSL